VPESSFEDVRRALSEKFGKVFDQSVVTMPFSASLFKEPPYEYLDQFLDTLKEAKETGKCFLMPPRIKHSIKTGLYEAYYTYKKEPTEDSRLLVDKMADINKFLEDNEFAQIDEIHLVTNPKVVFKRAIGEETAFDIERQKLVQELMLHLAFSDKIYEQVSIECIDKVHTEVGSKVQKKGASFNEHQYEKIVKPELVNKALELLEKQESENLKGLAQDAVFRLLLTKPLSTDTLKQIEMLITNHKLTESDRQLVDTALRVIFQILPLSLSRAYNAKNGYGRDLVSGKMSALPYEAPGIAKLTQYAEPNEKIVYSIQMYFCEGLPKSYAHELLSTWRKEAAKKGRDIQDTPQYERFTKLMPATASFSLPETDPQFPQLLETFRVAIAKDPKILKAFFKEKLFQDITFYKESAVSTPHTLLGSSKYVSAYSGTPHEESLPENMEVKREEGTDGKTTIAVDKKLEVGVYSDAERPLSDQVIEMFTKDPNLMVFIDSGGWLKDENVRDFSYRLLKKRQKDGIEGVFFYEQKKRYCMKEDDRGRPFVVEAEKSGLEKELQKRLTVLGQNEETGTDIKQHPTAKAFVSIRKEMSWTDENQAVSRMREITSGQDAAFGITTDVKADIVSQLFGALLENNETFRHLFEKKPPISLCTLNISETLKKDLVETVKEYNKKTDYEDRQNEFLKILTGKCTLNPERIWKYLASNEADVGTEEKKYAAKHKIREKKEQPHRKVMTDTKKDINERLEAFTAIESLVIEQETGKYLWSGVASGGELEVEQQMEMEQEKEREIESLHVVPVKKPVSVEKVVIGVPTAKEFEPLAPTVDAFFEMSLPKIKDLVPKELTLPNIDEFEYSKNLIADAKALDSKESLEHYLDDRYIFVLDDGKKRRYIFVSNQDAERIKKGLCEEPLSPGRMAGLFTFDGEEVVQKSTQNKKLQPGVEILVQAKLCMGKKFKKASEVKQLFALEPKAGWRDYYERRIRLLPSIAKDYTDSLLHTKFIKKFGGA
jgi:hypothetical protein